MAAVVSARDGDALDESVYQGSEASPPQPPPSWAYVPADILGGVLLLLPCVADRASVRSVCRHWRAAAHARVQALPAPLPVLVLPRFIRFSCLTSDSDGAARLMTAARRALMPVVAAGDDVWTLGSCDDWLMAVKQTGDRCFLVNAFSREVSHLPCLQINSHQCYHCLDDVSSSPVGTSFHGWMLRSALSASPSSSVQCGCLYLPRGRVSSWTGSLATWNDLMVSLSKLSNQ